MGAISQDVVDVELERPAGLLCETGQYYFQRE